MPNPKCNKNYVNRFELDGIKLLRILVCSVNISFPWVKSTRQDNPKPIQHTHMYSWQDCWPCNNTRSHIIGSKTRSFQRLQFQSYTIPTSTNQRLQIIFSIQIRWLFYLVQGNLAAQQWTWTKARVLQWHTLLSIPEIIMPKFSFSFGKKNSWFRTLAY